MNQSRNVIAFGAVFVVLALMFVLSACTKQLSATMRFGPTNVEYGCTASPNNNRCIVVIRDSIAPGNMPILITDTVPIGVTRTVAITRTLTPGQRVVVLGSFEGLTATGRKAGAVAARAETVYDPEASQAVPFLRFEITP